MLRQELLISNAEIGDVEITRIEHLELTINAMSDLNKSTIKAGEINVHRLYSEDNPESNHAFLKLSSGSRKNGVSDYFSGELITVDEHNDVTETLSFEKAYIQSFSSNDGMKFNQRYMSEDLVALAANGVDEEELWQSAVIRISDLSQEQAANNTTILAVAGFGDND